MPLIYHLTTEAAWTQRGNGLFGSPSLESEGFVHCSALDQLIAAAERHLTGQSGVIALAIDPAKLTAPLVWEDTSGRGERFPHIYGGIEIEAVVETFTIGGPTSFSLPEAPDEQRSRRWGLRWGLAGGVALRSVDEVREMAAWADDAGFDSFWVSQSNAVDPIVALAAAADQAPGLSEVGTSVVPLFGRHPLGLAQMTRTAQSILGGRLTLGIGPSHREPVEGGLGLSWDRPFSYTREFLDGLLPLLAGEAADATGDQVTTRADLAIDARPTPVLLAALGPKMLKLAGERVEGVTVGQCGPKTIREFIAPTVGAAAESAGRPTPRIMALIRLCVTDQPEVAYKLAQEVGAFYQALPSYAGVIAREGVSDAADLFLIGSENEVLEGLAAYADAGVTDFRLEIVAPDEGSLLASRDFLARYLA